MKLLTIYLCDHLAGATAGLELAKRTYRANRTSQFGAPLAALQDEIDADRATLIAVMGRLDVTRDRLKETAAWAAEKAGRLKLNGQLQGYSPLSRVLELEGLAIGIGGKLALWRSLGDLPGVRQRAGVDFEMLATRAEAQQAQVAELHARAVALAFG